MQNSLKQLMLQCIKKEGLNTALKKPLVLESARGAGYIIKKTFTVVVKYRKGNHRHPLPTKGRTHSKYYSIYSAKLSHKDIIVKRTMRKFVNCSCIGSYKLFHHAGYNYYELVLTTNANN